MKNPFDIAKTSPLLERPKSVAETVVHFTPVDVPANKPENVTGALLANFEFAGTAVNPGSFRCPVCGHNSDNADLFCIGCGEYLEAQEEESVEEVSAAPVAPACGDCGTEINPDEIFCMSCGSVVAM
jgi:hypothetical protein